VRVHRVDTAQAARALVPGADSVAAEVAEIVAAVRAGGDATLAEYVARFDTPAGGGAAALPDLDVAIANVRAVAQPQLGDDVDVALPQGHTVTVRELPGAARGDLRSGRAQPLPLDRRDGRRDREGGRRRGGRRLRARRASADPRRRRGLRRRRDLPTWVARTRSPRWRTAPRRSRASTSSPAPATSGSRKPSARSPATSASTGSSGPATCSCSRPSVPTSWPLDLLAQAEHGEGTIVVAASSDAALLDDVEARLAAAPETGAVAALVRTDELLAFAEAFAPEHLQLIGTEELAADVRSAGCVFVGAAGATAFGDYVAGSNHSLPTGGTARFASALSPKAFRRRMSVVRIGDAAAALARAGAPLARAEGFEQHARSMELRENQEQ
jgi:histidinol dehydrogenase